MHSHPSGKESPLPWKKVQLRIISVLIAKENDFYMFAFYLLKYLTCFFAMHINTILPAPKNTDFVLSDESIHT
jgi:hypothetical protein